MKIIKQYSHKQGEELLTKERPHLLTELKFAIEQVNAAECLTKESLEASKIRAWGGLVFSPRAINFQFKSILYPNGWAKWDAKKGKYTEYALNFSDGTTRKGNDRFRK